MRVGFIGLGNMGAPMAGFVRQAGGSRGVQLLDAPLDGGREGALEGELTLFVGGSEAILLSVKPVLDTFSRTVVWVGELGAGSVTKIVHNALAMSVDLLIAECMTLGVKAGGAKPRPVEAFAARGLAGRNMTFPKRLPGTPCPRGFSPPFPLGPSPQRFSLP